MLHIVMPRAPGISPIRAMFVSEALHNVLQSPPGDEEWEQRVGELQADLERFVTGEQIDPSYLFLLYPSRDAIWEIRSAAYDPSIRVLGLFAERDLFIATTFALRKELGGWQSRAWREVKRTASAAWRWLFFTQLPMTSLSINDLVSGAIDGKYFKAEK